MPRHTAAPTLDDIAILAEQAFAAIPPVLRDMARGVPIRVEEFPDEETVREMELDSPYDLLGLYSGIPFGARENAVPQQVDMIFLYRRPMLDYWCESGEDLTHLVRHVLIHEIGHHFGLSDEDMEALEAQAG